MEAALLFAGQCSLTSTDNHQGEKTKELTQQHRKKLQDKQKMGSLNVLLTVHYLAKGRGVAFLIRHNRGYTTAFS